MNSLNTSSMNYSKSPQIVKYLRVYQSNKSTKKSLVFAPLADAYRKAGLFKEALSVLREGLKDHPQYVSGLLVLSQTYVDLEKYEYALNTLSPIVDNHPENILMQKTYAFLCKKMNKNDEAKRRYTHLKFLCPKDPFISRELEDLSLEEKSYELPVFPDYELKNQAKKDVFVYDEIWLEREDSSKIKGEELKVFDNWQEESLLKRKKLKILNAHKLILENFLKKLQEKRFSA